MIKGAQRKSHKENISSKRGKRIKEGQSIKKFIIGMVEYLSADHNFFSRANNLESERRYYHITSTQQNRGKRRKAQANECTSEQMLKEI